jgi:hypothetical protein
MKSRLRWNKGLIIFLVWAGGLAYAGGLGHARGVGGQPGGVLEIWPWQAELELHQPQAGQAGPQVGPLLWGRDRETLHIRIHTRGLSGRLWKLWALPHPGPAGNLVQVIHYEGQPPLMSGRLQPNQRTLVGHGHLDGRPVAADLMLWAQGHLKGGDRAPIQVEFILETLP